MTETIATSIEIGRKRAEKYIRACMWVSRIRMLDARGGTCDSGWQQNFVEVVADELQTKWLCHTRERMCDGREMWDSMGAGTVHPWRQGY
ncbi:hypothetical protein A2U01_0032832 [Trifolium medium]|uniref:Uncharacterized protein n=1 Tax=Trifolium medium TaxID=97028 RepID=A0A392PJU4_9FABA|nr:hypothetical protein [Trifolium medium]